MLGSCRLNNKSMRNVRRTEAYQAIAIDLALLGVISKEECEMLLDGGIPSGIVLPDGSSKLMSEKELPPKPDFIQTESEQETQETQETQEPVDETQETVSDGAATDDIPSVDPEPVDETQEPVDDEGRTESDN